MTCETIAKIVKASGVSAGELILIHFWGENADKTVADQFAAAVAALGASPVVLQQARSVNREIFAGAKESCFDERYFGLFSKFDAVLDVFACQPIVLGYELEDAQMDLCGHTLLDEKMAGTFHIAVGANTMFGGENRATDHGDFVGRGEVEVLARGTTGYWRVKPEKNLPGALTGQGLVIAAGSPRPQTAGSKTLHTIPRHPAPVQSAGRSRHRGCPPARNRPRARSARPHRR